MGSHSHLRSPLSDILVERIERHGPLTFAAFMEACLYDPEHGYYIRCVPEKTMGDYFTSPDVGPLFARLLTRQWLEMWQALGMPAGFDLVECGAARGRLAEQTLQAVEEQSQDFSAALRLTLIETSPALRAQAQTLLARFGDRVRVADGLPAGGVVGCIFSNELLDALPVHRVVQHSDGLREIYVGAPQGELREEEGELSTAAIAEYLDRYGASLDEGQQAEVHLAALDWLEGAAAALERGFLVTIDYGYQARELYGPGYQRGTVMAYRDHCAHEDWLVRPGQQDLTAHVNFTALLERGRELGLETLGLIPQNNFLLALGRASACADIEPPGATEKAKLKARLALRQLIHPEGMGETFKVLVQGKSVVGGRLSGLEPLQAAPTRGG
jgi:SAM-dependent MidA family methyltransferase